MARFYKDLYGNLSKCGNRNNGSGQDNVFLRVDLKVDLSIPAENTFEEKNFKKFQKIFHFVHAGLGNR